MTPYYEQDGITIYHGDCRELVHRLRADVLLTDPPYGVVGGKGGDAHDFGKARYEAQWDDTEEYVADVCVPVIETVLAYTRRGAVTTGIRCQHLYPRPADIGCFWTPASATHGPWGFACQHPIFYYGKDFRAGKGAWPSSRQVTEMAEKNGHPCPKPEGAWLWLLTKVADEGETVIDPFMGSGTTLVAAKRLGRKAVGVELEERYCEIAAKRLAQGALPMEFTA